MIGNSSVPTNPNSQQVLIFVLKSNLNFCFCDLRENTDKNVGSYYPISFYFAKISYTKKYFYSFPMHQVINQL
jgi:hypothetical protein